MFWLYLYAYLPESKGRSVEDITAEFRRKSGEERTRGRIKDNLTEESEEDQ